MRKAHLLLVMIPLLSALVLSLVPVSLSTHSGTVMWMEDEGTLYQRVSSKIYRDVYPGTPPYTRWPWLNFTVKNNGPDPIFRIKLVIPKNGTGYVDFHYWESRINMTGWSATPDEYDNTGWPGVVIFETATEYIEMGQTGKFCIKFTGSRVPTCNRLFYVYTIDKGSQPETKPHELWVETDPYVPEGPNMIFPRISEGTASNPIGVMFNPYALHWYFWLNLTVKDTTAEHETGISRVEMLIDEYNNGTIDRAYFYPGLDGFYEPEKSTVRIEEKIWDIPRVEGLSQMTLRIRVYDGAHNLRTFERDFYVRLQYDHQPPSIDYLYQVPASDNVYPDDIVDVYAHVTDDLSGIRQVNLSYTTDNGTWFTDEMMLNEDQLYSSSIPKFPYLTKVTYVVTAEDYAHNYVSTEEKGYIYKYEVVPETSLLMIVVAPITLFAVGLYRRKHLR